MRPKILLILTAVLTAVQGLQGPALPLKIYDTWVDASAYADSHVGGRWLMEKARGKDVTALFAAIHVNEAKARAALAKLPTYDGDDEKAHVFDLAKASPEVIFSETEELPLNSDLRRELQELVRSRFETLDDMKATPAHWLRTFAFAGLTLSCWNGWAHGDVTATALLPFAHWLLAAHTCHDATHGSLSSNPSVNYWLQFTAHPIFFNVFVWIPQHLFSHHQFTNDIRRDVDVHHFAPARLSKDLPTTGAYEADQSAAWTFVVKGCLTTLGTCILQPLRTLLDLKTTNFDTNITPVSDGVSKLAVLASLVPSLCVLAYHPLLQALHGPPCDNLAFLILWPWIGSSIIWTTMTQTSHVQESTQASGDCWTAAQVATSLDYSVHSAEERSLVAGLTGGLNMQALHHALPSISQNHMATLYDDFVAICQRHNVHRATSRNLATASKECLDFVFHTNNLLDLGPPPRETVPSSPPPR